MPQSVADAKPSSNHRDAAPTSKHRDGFAELSAMDQPNMARRASLFQGVKLAAEYAGMRPLRHTLHLDPSTAPPGAKVIYLLRHGEGVHNVWRHAEQAAGRTPTAKRHNQHRVPAGLHDPVLTSQGLADAAAAAELARALPRPQLCVCSPMRRTTQTLLVAFGGAFFVQPGYVLDMVVVAVCLYSELFGEMKGASDVARVLSDRLRVTLTRASRQRCACSAYCACGDCCASTPRSWQVGSGEFLGSQLVQHEDFSITVSVSSVSSLATNARAQPT